MNLLVKFLLVITVIFIIVIISTMIKLHKPSSKKLNSSQLPQYFRLLKFCHLSYLNLSDPAYFNKGSIKLTLTNPDIKKDPGFKKFSRELETIIWKNNYIKNFLSGLEGWSIYLAKGDKGSFWKTMGFWAVAYKKNNNIVISFRGTDDLSSISYDFASVLLQTDIHTQTNLAKDFLKSVYDKVQDEKITGPIKVILTGHSLGGYIAQRITLDIYDQKITGYSVKGTKMKLSETVTFNAPGFKRNFLLHIQKAITNEQYSNSKDYRVKNFINAFDNIGQFGKHIGNDIYINGSKNFVGRHSLLSFYKDLPHEAKAGKKPLLIALTDGTFRDYQGKGLLKGKVITYLGWIGQALPYIIILMLPINLFVSKIYIPKQAMTLGQLFNHVLIFLFSFLLFSDRTHNFKFSALLSVLMLLLIRWILYLDYL
ncbi:Mbeg1-like protein [Bacillus toyonensis]|uniref:Mbeg1-like protein n=1 Tax=Bacillus toyonensis TaxID=155322 RepID=UPI0015CF6A4B|nr:Mbeg1-like protein [Bacillus toyonensis]